MKGSINQLLNLPGTTLKEMIDVEGYICFYLEMTSGHWFSPTKI